MSTASTVAAIVVALATIAVVARWPFARPDRRSLERRARSLEALALVVARTTAVRDSGVVHIPRTGAAGCAPRHPAVSLLDVATEGAPAVGPATVRSPAPLPDAGAPPAAPAALAKPDVGRVVRLEVVDLPPGDDPTGSVDALDLLHGPVPASASGPPPTGRKTTGGETHRRGTTGWAARALGRPQRGTAQQRDIRTVPAVPRRRLLVAATVLVVGGLVTAGVRPSLGPPESTVGDAATAEPTVPAPPASTIPPPLAPSGDTRGGTVAFTIAAPLTLDLAASAPSWVRVQTTDGVVLFEGTLAGGDATRVAVGSPVLVRLGNPAGVLAAADGRRLDHPRPPGEPLTLRLG